MYSDIKKLKITRSVVISLLSLSFLTGCGGNDSGTNQTPTNPPSKQNIQLSNIKAYPGNRRIRFSWKLLVPSDKTADKIVISWNNNKDSLQVPVPTKDSIIVDNLSEGKYTFNFIAVGDKGSHSTQVVKKAKAYGPKYQSSLNNRTVNSTFHDKNNHIASVYWEPPLSSELATILTYEDNTGKSQILRVPHESDSTALDNYPSDADSVSFSYTSIYRPTPTAIDTFSTSVDRFSEKIGSKQLINLDYQKLVRLRKKDANFYNLKRAADQALDEGPFSVMQKKQVASSGDKHDYYRLGTYWWPNPDTEDGLPWIRKDGQVNPLSQGDNSDSPAMKNLTNNVRTLSLAYFFTRNQAYASKAQQLLKTWFLDPSTKMNPNLNYVAGVPGRTTGRASGIISFSGGPTQTIITAIKLLQAGHALDKQTLDGLKGWFGDYLDWLQNSSTGREGKEYENNIGTMFDVQEVAILLFLDRRQEARTVLETVKQHRIASQITKDGKQPEELRRTKTLSYSVKNLRGLTHLAYFGTKLGVDLWNYDPADAGGIKDAYAFMHPYATGEKTWERQQIRHLSSAVKRLKRLFGYAGSMFTIDEYCQIGNATKAHEYNRLMYPCFDSPDP